MRDPDSHASHAGTRRDFLRRAAWGTGAALLGGALGTWPPEAAANGKVDALLLSCMDYRLTGKTTAYMQSRGLAKNYDHVILAGASLGVLNEKFKQWGDTFWQHVDIALELHGIRRLIVLDHRDCGAYQVFLPQDLSKDRGLEFRVHAEQMRRLRSEIQAKHPSLKVELRLMDLDGRVETVS